MNALKICNLSKKIGRCRILEDLSLTVKSGEIVGVVGENGAGKSSLLKCISGLWRVNLGSVEVFGKDIVSDYNDCLSRMGTMVEYPALFGEYTLAENIEFFSAYYKKDCNLEAENLIKLLHIEELKNRKIKTFSSGMKQKAVLLIVLMKKPEILLLDEPTAMLDPKVSAEVRNLIRSWHKEYGTTVLISSHNLTEIENLCRRAVIIKNGRIVGEKDLSDRPKRVYKLKLFSAKEAERISRLINSEKAWADGEYLCLYATSDFLKEVILNYNLEFSDMTVSSGLEQSFTEV